MNDKTKIIGKFALKGSDKERKIENVIHALFDQSMRERKNED